MRDKKDFITISSLCTQHLLNQGHQLIDIIPILSSAAASIDNVATGTHNGSIIIHEQMNKDNTLALLPSRHLWKYNKRHIQQNTIQTQKSMQPKSYKCSVWCHSISTK